jgi:hypothetical protein
LVLFGNDLSLILSSAPPGRLSFYQAHRFFVRTILYNLLPLEGRGSFFLLSVPAVSQAEGDDNSNSKNCGEKYFQWLLSTPPLVLI